MDKEQKSKRFDWLPIEMPNVARLVKRHRVEMGDAHINECWRRGVLQKEPGWFFAREGALAVGTPWTEPEMSWNLSSTQAMLMVKTPEMQHGPE